MLYCKLKSRHGAILLEVLLAIVILALGLTGILQAMMTQTRAASVALDYFQAANALDGALAQKFLESEPQVFVEEKTSCASFDKQAQCIVQETGEMLSSFPEMTIKRIEGEIAWPSGKNSRSLTAAFYLPKVKEQ